MPKQSLAILLVFWGAILPLRAADRQQQLLDGLRQRRLFDLAEHYCREQLQESDLSDRQRVTMVVELMRTLAQQALHAPPDEREAHWQAARQVAEQFRSQSRDHPRQVLVQLQEALVLLAQAELQRQEAELTGGDLQPAREILREATRLLETLQDELTRQIPQRHRQRAAEVELTAHELLSLQTHARYQLARAFRNQALCYDRGSEDRVAALLRSAEFLEQAATQVAPQDPLAGDIQLAQITCWRFLGELDRARQALEPLLADETPVALRLRARSEALRVAVADRQVAEIERRLAEGREIEGWADPELDLAHLEAALVLSEQAEEERQASEWQKRAAAQASLIEQEHGSYWGRRAQLLLVHRLPESFTATNLEVLSQSADQLYLQRQYDQAVAAYEQAAQLARQQGQLEAAFQLHYKAALVLQQHGTPGQWVERLRSLALALPQYPQASQVHLQAIAAAADLVRVSAEHLPQYQQMLHEHIRTWPAEQTADQARLWLGRIYEFQKEDTAALETYMGVAPESIPYQEAVAAAERCFTRLIGERQGAELTSEAEKAVAFFEQIVLGTAGELPERWSAAQRAAALAAARLRLKFLPSEQSQAERLLAAALNGEGEPHGLHWKHDAQVQLARAWLVPPRQLREARAMLQQLARESPQHVLQFLQELRQHDLPEPSHELALLQLDLVQQLAEDEQLDGSQQRFLRRVQAQALQQSGRRQEALDLYRQLLEEDSRDAELHQEFAHLLSQSDQPAELQEALQQWRRIAQHTRPRTQLWYTAKYEVALLQYKLGQRKDAVQLIQYLQATGDLDQAPNKQQFLQLLQQAQN